MAKMKISNNIPTPAPKQRSRSSNIVMHFAMTLVAVVIGIALYTEQKFSVPIALGTAILAFVAFRSVHYLLDTARQSASLGTNIPNTMMGTLIKSEASDRTPAVAPQKVIFPKTPLDETIPKSVTVAPIDPASMELLKPTGEMTSELIAQALKRQLPAMGEAAMSDTAIGEQEKTSGKPQAEVSTGVETPETALSSPQDLPLAKSEDAQITDMTPTDAMPTNEMIDQIAQELTTIRPEIGTISIDSITRDLEAATRALEEQLKATTQEHPTLPHMSEPEFETDIAEVETVVVEKVEAETEIAAEAEAIAEAATEPDISDELGLQNIVKDAIATNQAHLYLQPILGLATRKAESFEVLTHLQNTEGKMLPPSDFVDEAERAGQMPAIDDIMLIRTMGVLRKLQASGAPGTMFCNLSIFSLSDDEVMGGLMNALSDDPVSADRLVIELSEQAYLALTPSDRERLKDLTELGVRLSLDQLTDAGIFMDALKNRMFSFIKIDAAFFLDKLGSGGDALMPAEILSEATLAGVDLIVEKLETSEDLERAIGFGAKYGQGYVFSGPRPVKAELLEDAA